MNPDAVERLIPVLPSATLGDFTFADLVIFAGVAEPKELRGPSWNLSDPDRCNAAIANANGDAELNVTDPS